MSTSDTHVIVGGGLAGAKAAETLRSHGFDGRIVLLGAENEQPYERPPLSKEVLRGEAEDSTALVHDPAFYGDNAIELRLGVRVDSLDVAGRTVTTSEGDELTYSRLLLATGAEPRRLRIRGAELPGIHYLRTLSDSRELRTALHGAGRLAIVGAGWIGSEVAASARQLGVEVALIDPLNAPLERVLGPELGRVYLELHRERGVDLHMETSVAEFSGRDRVTGVVTSDGAQIEADVVVVGIGVEPRVDLARQAGLDVQGGVVVDATLETSAPGVFAAGDLATAWHPTLHEQVRVEHWANALNQGVTAAQNMLGEAIPYDRLPYFFSDQYDLGMEYCGYATSWDEVVFRGDPASREFIAFWLADGAVVATLNANVWDVVDDLQALIASGHKPDREALTDQSAPLGSLTGAR
jgi:3-phenylpropionate/trans-cinnamate dioxygenase ferredoxin reductase component